MDPLTITAAAGMRSRLEALDILSNNIANASTVGFKADRDAFLPWSSEYAATSLAEPTEVPDLSRQWTDFSQGSILKTDGLLDLAIQGKGFFEVVTAQGARWTRNGAFQLSAADGKIRSSEGHILRVRPPDGSEFRLRPNLGIEITPEGQIKQEGRLTGTIEVMDFENMDVLQKEGHSYFRMQDSTSQPKPAASFQMMQGYIENANAGAVESSVRLVSVLRQFEALQKATTIGAEMNRRSVEEVARVNA